MIRSIMEKHQFRRAKDLNMGLKSLCSVSLVSLYPTNVMQQFYTFSFPINAKTVNLMATKTRGRK